MALHEIDTPRKGEGASPSRNAGDPDSRAADRTDAGAARAASRRTRLLYGLIGMGIRLTVAIGIVGAGIAITAEMVANRPPPAERDSFERSFIVQTLAARHGTFTPTISAFGTVNAALTLAIRAPAGGDVIFVADNLRPGGKLEAGQVLVKVDPFNYQLSVADARTKLEDARSTLQEAQEQLRLQKLNAQFATSSLELAQADLRRARALFDAGSLTSQQLESRELVVSQREQALRQAQSAITLQEGAVKRAQTGIQTAERALERAERALADTTISTPYDAVVVNSNVVPGATFAQGENVATIYKANALEVRFTLSEAQYGQLLADGLEGRPIRVIWDIGPTPVRVNGTISRVGARIDTSQGGVEIFGTLDADQDTPIRPGTFVSVEMDGISYSNALEVPETAIYEGDILYVEQDQRMKSVPVTILQREGDKVIIRADVADGDAIIVTRLAEAGDGVLVKHEEERETPARAEGTASQAAGPAENTTTKDATTGGAE